MEPEHHKDQTTSDREERPASNDQAAFTAPFASEGLEQLRDSHC